MSKKNGGCGCGGKCGNPECGPKRKNGTKRPADEHQFARWRESAKRMTDAELHYSIKDARKAAEAMRGHDPVAEGWYYDEAFTYADELRHRHERPTGRRNPAQVQYDSDDYKRGLFQGAVEKGKAPPPRGTSAELQRGYAAGARIAAAQPKALAKAMGVYEVTSDQVRAGQALQDAVLDHDPVANPRTRRNPFEVIDGELYEDGRHIPRMTPAEAKKAYAAPKCSGYLCGKPATTIVSASFGGTAPFCAKHAAEERRLLKKHSIRNPMSAAERKHCAHERSEERSFASLLNKLPEGETVTLGGRRVRKLSKGFVVVDGERLPAKQAAAKIHRGR